jgi:cell division protein FtsI (penicillin-binding protein 3)
VAWLGLSARLVQIQVLRHDEYSARAREQYQRRIELKANRGRVMDRRGNDLAVDIQATSFYAYPDQVQYPERVAAQFAALGEQSAEHIASQLRGDKPFVYLARQVVDQDLARIGEVRFDGVSRHPETRRQYPLGALAGQLIGHTNVDNRGSEGVERTFDGVLREKDGLVLGFVDARGKQVAWRQQHREEPEHGRDLVLTIDAIYQGILEEELQRAIDGSQAEGALGVILDPRNGEVLAMANLPLFDPNFASHASPELRRNRAIADAYEPGSTFKVIAAAAVLEEGLARLEDRVFCERGKLELSNGEIIRDTRAYGDLLFSQVLEKSSNIGLIKFARRLSRPRFYEYIRRFGFATRTGIDLPAENSGLLQNVDQWSERSLETIAIGQEIGATALQLALAYGAIANGGVLMVPKLVKGVVGADGRLEKLGGAQSVRRVIRRETAATLRSVLAGVVANGTGRRAQIAGVAVGGKTGTAQRAAEDGSGYDPDASIASFAGFLPVQDPQFVCVIMVENPQIDAWGGKVAAPAFQRVMERILHLPGGLLVGRATKAPSAGMPVVPDLRGMTRVVARFQAELRGLPVAFSGAGDVVVNQDPPPGTEGRRERIDCTLGRASDSHRATRGSLRLRQAQLLEVASARVPRGI